MMEKEETNLLLDLLSLSRRYGEGTIGRLESKLSRGNAEDSIFELLDIMDNKDLVLKAISKYSEKMIDDTKIGIRIRVLGQENRDIVSAFARDLYGEKIFASKGDLLKFVRENHIQISGVATRKMIASVLLDYTIDLPEESMRQFIEAAYARSSQSNSLEGWASIILKK